MSLRSLVRHAIQRRRYRRQGVKIGRECKLVGVSFEESATIESFCRLIGDPRIEIGVNFYANCFCHFLGEITIGSNVLIGPHSVIWGRDHGYASGTLIREQDFKREPVRIGDDCWLGAHVTILKGVTIGSGCVVGAGSVVVEDLPENAVAVGNPAKVIRYRE